MGPLFQQLANTQKEHDGACRIEVIADNRNRNRCGIQHFNLDLTLHQTTDTLPYITDGFDGGINCTHRSRKKQFGTQTFQTPVYQFVLIFLIQFPSAVHRNDFI